MKKYYCDICNKELDSHITLKTDILGAISLRDIKYEKKYDLCRDCTDKIFNFIEGSKNGKD